MALSFSPESALTQIDHALVDVLTDHPIEARPALLLDLPCQVLADLQFRPRPQPFGGDLGGSSTHTTGDVVAGDDEVLTTLIPPAQQDVGVRVIGVPMIHGHPFALGTEVALDL